MLLAMLVSICYLALKLEYYFVRCYNGLKVAVSIRFLYKTLDSLNFPDVLAIATVIFCWRYFSRILQRFHY
jgi:hypothetical protein